MNVNMVFLPEQNRPDGSIRSDKIKKLFWYNFFVTDILEDDSLWIKKRM